MATPCYAMQCPSCDRTLREVQHHGVHVDVCDCGGMWFDRGELAQWMARQKQARRIARPERAERQPAEPLRCPKCLRSSLHEFAGHDMGFTMCDQGHGVWLTASQVAHAEGAPAEDDADAWWWGLLEAVAYLPQAW